MADFLIYNREQGRLRQRKRRENLTDEQRALERQKDRERKRMSQEPLEICRQKARERKRKQRQNESEESAKRRREKQRIYNRELKEGLKVHKQYIERIWSFPDIPCMICRKLKYKSQLRTVEISSLKEQVLNYL